MLRLAYLTPTLAVAGAMAREDFAQAAAQGFVTIVNNRPDHEEAAQLTAREEVELSAKAGVRYVFLPAAKHEVLEPYFVDALEQALSTLEGPILLHCRSGLRSTIAWAAVAVRSGIPVDDVIATARAAGHDLEAVREEIAAYAGTRSEVAGEPQAAAA